MGWNRSMPAGLILKSRPPRLAIEDRRKFPRLEGDDGLGGLGGGDEAEVEIGHGGPA